MSKDFGSQNVVEVDLEAIPEASEPIKATSPMLKCTICHKVFDKVHPYKDCIVYYHSKGCDTILTIPNKEK
jgi:hypothetical protein